MMSVDTLTFADLRDRLKDRLDELGIKLATVRGDEYLSRAELAEFPAIRKNR